MGIILSPPSAVYSIPWEGIRLPYTYSVKNRVGASTRPLLQLAVILLATEREEIFREVCEKCKSREGEKRGADECVMDLIDFHSKCDILDFHEGKATITFRFVCDSKHHGRESDAFRWVHILIRILFLL